MSSNVAAEFWGRVRVSLLVAPWGVLTLGYQGFVRHSCGRESLSTKGVPLLSELRVAEQDQPSLLAGHGVVNSEALLAAVAAVGQGKWHESKAKADAIAELGRREICAVQAVWK